MQRHKKSAPKPHYPASLVYAAIKMALCPPQGGYRDGASAEDCYAAVCDEVEALTGKRPDDEWISEEELNEWLRTD